jgi:hypothetical protein
LDQCRLCGGTIRLKFSRHGADVKVDYFQCSTCECLQTEEPYWLPQAYNVDIPQIDAFAVERALSCRNIIWCLFKICDISPQDDKLLDWGGGQGLLARMLRDVGIDAYLYDRYDKNVYACSFDFSKDAYYKVATSLEVWEHFDNPRANIDEFFSLNSEFFLVSTCRYCGQDENWPYLGEVKDQHVFFYSDKSLEWIATTYGYKVALFPSDFVLFYKNSIPKIRIWAFKQLVAHHHLCEIFFALKRKRSRALEDSDRQHAACHKLAGCRIGDAGLAHALDRGARHSPE